MVEIIVNKIRSLLGWNLPAMAKQEEVKIEVVVEDENQLEDCLRVSEDSKVNSSEDRPQPGKAIKEKKVLSVEDIYTPLSVAKEEIWRRWNDKELRKKVEDFLGEIPEVFTDKPKAIIFRNIASPNLEMQIAHEYAGLLGLDLVVVEYTADKFCTRNRDKLHLGKMMFFNGKNKTNATGKENSINIMDNDNKPFSEIKTTWDENFISFHHRILKENGFNDVKTFDISIYEKMGLSPREMYFRIFSLCSQCTVLLENFIVKTDKGEKLFVDNIVLPAFIENENRFGQKPLITQLCGADDEGSVCWQYYPEEIKKYLNKIC